MNKLKLTKEQLAILDSISAEFGKINEIKTSKNKFNYIDVEPILNLKELVQEEKEVCKAMFKASLNALMPLVEQKFNMLIDDLSIVEGLTFDIIKNYQQIELVISGIWITCKAWGLTKPLSDGYSKEAYDIEPEYNIRGNGGNMSVFKTFEELIESDRFKFLIKETIINLK